jgi:hypothetical protein
VGASCWKPLAPRSQAVIAGAITCCSTRRAEVCGRDPAGRPWSRSRRLNLGGECAGAPVKSHTREVFVGK